MRVVLFSSALVLAFGAQMVKADANARLLGCYKKVTIPAKYEVTKVLIKKPERKYVSRNGRIELWEYPAIYREDKKLLEASHEVMREISCK